MVAGSNPAGGSTPLLLTNIDYLGEDYNGVFKKVIKRAIAGAFAGLAGGILGRCIARMEIHPILGKVMELAIVI